MLEDHRKKKTNQKRQTEKKQAEADYRPQHSTYSYALWNPLPATPTPLEHVLPVVFLVSPTYLIKSAACDRVGKVTVALLDRTLELLLLLVLLGCWE